MVEVKLGEKGELIEKYEKFIIHHLSVDRKTNGKGLVDTKSLKTSLKIYSERMVTLESKVKK